jgi:phosphoglycolate phosphatase
MQHPNPLMIIFDFDGTLADTLAVMVKITNRIAPEFGYQKLTQERVADLKYLSPWEVIKLLAVPLWKLPFVLRRVKQEFNVEVDRVELFPGILDVLYSLKAQHYYLGIVSSNAEVNIRSILNKYEIEHLFEFVATANTFGKGRKIAKSLSQYKIDRDRVIYIGDEIRDIQAARSIGVKIIAVGWGFNDATALLKQDPDLLVTKPQALLTAIDRLNPNPIFVTPMNGILTTQRPLTHY